MKHLDVEEFSAVWCLVPLWFAQVIFDSRIPLFLTLEIGFLCRVVSTRPRSFFPAKIEKRSFSHAAYFRPICGASRCGRLCPFPLCLRSVPFHSGSPSGQGTSVSFSKRISTPPPSPQGRRFVSPLRNHKNTRILDVCFLVISPRLFVGIGVGSAASLSPRTYVLPCPVFPLRALVIFSSRSEVD